MKRRSASARLGRDHCVVRRTWAVDQDRAAHAPQTSLLATRRTAADAADLARSVAQLFQTNGYDKAAGCWWATDGKVFHQFAARDENRTRRRPNAALATLLISAVAVAVAAPAIGRMRKAKR